VAEPVRSSTANASATPVIASPSSEMICPVKKQPELALAESVERIDPHYRFLPGLSSPFGSKVCLIRVCRS
jgi:hypothetical protein